MSLMLVSIQLEEDARLEAMLIIEMSTVMNWIFDSSPLILLDDTIFFLIFSTGEFKLSIYWAYLKECKKIIDNW